MYKQQRLAPTGVLFFFQFKVLLTHSTPNINFFLPVGRVKDPLAALISSSARHSAMVFDVPESTLTGTGCQEINSLVNTSQQRYINSLTPHNTSQTNSSSIFPWYTINKGKQSSASKYLLKSSSLRFSTLVFIT